MNIVELLPKLQALPRGEKLRVVEFLVGEIAREEDLQPLVSGAAYQIWSPFDSSEAAATLQSLLEEERREQHA